ncbi:hypothetical protein CY35_04G079900 [Sphagnum magellanicum]|nr:hypothetical protein CY35_04G079900 [Sphagnum magellanicum]
MDVANSENFALDGGRTTVVHLIPGPFRVVLVNAALFCHYGFPGICYARAACQELLHKLEETVHYIEDEEHLGCCTNHLDSSRQHLSQSSETHSF